MKNYIEVPNSDSVNVHETNGSLFGFAADEVFKIDTVTDAEARGMNLTDLDRLIILAVNNFRVITSALLLAYFRKLSVDGVSESSIKRHLDHLCQASFIQSSRLVRAGSTSSIRVFSLGFRGKGWIGASGVAMGNMAGYISSFKGDSAKIKKVLSAVQYVIRSTDEKKDFLINRKIWVPDSATDLGFRADAVIFDKIHTQVLFSVRDDMNGLHALPEKLNRAFSVFSAQKASVEFISPEIVIVCENVDHMKHVMKVLGKKEYRYPIYYTCDTLVYSNPRQCVFALARPEPAQRQKTFIGRLIDMIS